MSEKIEDKKSSVMKDRLKWLENEQVEVKVDNGFTVKGHYVDILPLGKSYFIVVMNVNKKANLVETSKIVQLNQV